MRTITPLALIAMGATTGCAALSNHDDADRIDLQRVSMIERQARVRNVELHWVNMPQRKPDVAPAVAPPDAPTGT